ncbi:MAG: Lrp/AsnC family transcriptional regulator [Proteobacteria bacterium]|nr:Lrp/AsnC family transcriptional regulator [Pseudomonadota bacterium]MBU1232951.1 Lrp/AsnC family transcriptional regulator [Pseudomonadota bacterium]MBU1418692.1 Lrp/AsnC family transcriptional regulator [Pseudomonadota bacterium]MBU1454438.1 Lrp/AsnC family transcriptional regulator [Pseudomonadota bacterium]
MTALDEIDRKILNLLQLDGRMTNAELAGRVNLSPSACLRRVQILEQSGIIDSYVMLIRQEAVGKPTNVFVEITLNSQSELAFDAFEAAVKTCPEIMECFLMSGDSDYLIRVVASDTQDYERIHRQYLSRFPNVARVQSNFALRTVCKKTALEI